MPASFAGQGVAGGRVDPVIAGGMFALGLAFGSFLNVCIYRMPRGLSVVRPGSACPNCGKAIRFYDNVPVLSWVLLRGQCRNCSAQITPRYAVVELLTGGLFLVCYWHFVLIPAMLKFAMIGSFVGLRLTILTIFAASIAGSFFGLWTVFAVWIKRTQRRRHVFHESGAAARRNAWASAMVALRRHQMPFGVFLGSMGLVAVFVGRPFCRW